MAYLEEKESGREDNGGKTSNLSLSLNSKETQCNLPNKNMFEKIRFFGMLQLKKNTEA